MPHLLTGPCPLVGDPVHVCAKLAAVGDDAGVHAADLGRLGLTLEGSWTVGERGG